MSWEPVPNSDQLHLSPKGLVLEAIRLTAQTTPLFTMTMVQRRLAKRPERQDWTAAVDQAVAAGWISKTSRLETSQDPRIKNIWASLILDKPPNKP